MKKILFLILAAMVAFTACSVSRQTPTAGEAASPSWVGCETEDILTALGAPDRIDMDGRSGSILKYESSPSYSDPEYDILDPGARAVESQYAYFYLNSVGRCYRVESNRELPAAPAHTNAPAVLEWISGGVMLLPLILWISVL